MKRIQADTKLIPVLKGFHTHLLTVVDASDVASSQQPSMAAAFS